MIDYSKNVWLETRFNLNLINQFCVCVNGSFWYAKQNDVVCIYLIYFHRIGLSVSKLLLFDDFYYTKKTRKIENSRTRFPSGIFYNYSFCVCIIDGHNCLSFRRKEHSGTIWSSECCSLLEVKYTDIETKGRRLRLMREAPRTPRSASRALLNGTSNDRIAKREHYTRLQSNNDV